VVLAAIFASLEVIAYLVWWILFAIVGCSTVAGIRNLMAPSANSTTVRKWRGKWTAGDIATCSAKVMWIFVYAPLRLLGKLLMWTIELLVLPFRLLWKLGAGISHVIRKKSEAERVWPFLRDGKRGGLGDLVVVLDKEHKMRVGRIGFYVEQGNVFKVKLEKGQSGQKSALIRVSPRNLKHINEEEKIHFKHFAMKEEDIGVEADEVDDDTDDDENDLLDDEEEDESEQEAAVEKATGRTNVMDKKAVSDDEEDDGIVKKKTAGRKVVMDMD